MESPPICLFSYCYQRGEEGKGEGGERGGGVRVGKRGELRETKGNLRERAHI